MTEREHPRAGKGHSAARPLRAKPQRAANWRPATLAVGALMAVACASSAQAANGPPSATTACQALVGRTLVGGGKIDTATPVARGDLYLTANAGTLAASRSFCRLGVTLTPAKGSNIKAEIWLPEPEAWNGRFMSSGNGGYGGSLQGPLRTMHRALADGYASAGTDMGHTGALTDASWAYQQPARLEDWAHRANHVAADAAKQLIRLYYGRAPEHSYFNGCSDGGRQALMAALRYPNDYDGIVAGAPAMAWTEQMTGFVWNARTASAPGSALSQDDLQLLQRAALDQCDLRDGVKDGVIESPLACRFDPAALRCADGARTGCLTDAQITRVRDIMSGPHTSGGRSIFPGFEPSGAAVGWNQWITGPTADQPRYGEGYYRWMVFKDPKWSIDQFDLDRDYPRANRTTGRLVDSDDPDLRAFFRHGGKLLMYTGWLDAAVAPQSTIHQYEAIRTSAGRGHAENARLFVAAGMTHCGGGPGPNVFNALSAMDTWITAGQSPEQLLATKYANDAAGAVGLPTTVERTRPICAWPKTVRYKGSGPLESAASYSCAASKSDAREAHDGKSFSTSVERAAPTDNR
jgi:hypothetical protein